MALTYASFYGLARVNGSGPEVKNWAVTDSNWQTTALLLKAQELHQHNAATPMRYPGFLAATPATPIPANLNLANTGGSLSNGLTVGVRLSWLNSLGLETEASPEVTVQTPVVVTRPSALTTTGVLATPVPGGVPGGTWLYTLTKRLGAGESETADVLTVSVPYSTGQTSSTVPLNFAPISSYTDGTDSLCLYRSTGFDSSFVLLTSITATPGRQNNLSSYVDNNIVSNSAQQPPSSSQFAKQNSVTIDWTNILNQTPPTASALNVYVTQQAGVYGVNSQLQSYSLVNPATPIPNSYVYQGVETLAPGYPQEFSQIPAGAGLINLSTQAIGAPVYTTAANAMGWPTNNFVFPTGNANSTPLFGAAYVDPNGQLKVALATPSGANNPATFLTLAGVGAGYAHPNVESGGHSASHIQGGAAIGGPTQDQLNSIFSTPVAGGAGRYRIQATNIYQIQSTPTTVAVPSNGSWAVMSDLDTITNWPSGISPDFPGQWFEVSFKALLNVQLGANQVTENAQVMLWINGNQVNQTYCVNSVSTPVPQQYHTPSFTFATPLTRSNNRFQIQWLMALPGTVQSLGPNVPGQGSYRYFTIKELF